jgi:hypothetical protein
LNISAFFFFFFLLHGNINWSCLYLHGVHLAPGWSIPRLTQSSDFNIFRTGFVSLDDAMVATTWKVPLVKQSDTLMTYRLSP